MPTTTGDPRIDALDKVRKRTVAFAMIDDAIAYWFHAASLSRFITS